MGRIARVLSFVRDVANGANVSRVTVNPGGGANITADHLSPAGDDSRPLADDYCITVGTMRTGGAAVVGYIDHANPGQAGPGEKRIYARDDSGAIVCELWIKADGSATLLNDKGSIALAGDGSVEMKNGAGSMALATSGEFDLNGVIIDSSGNITLPGMIKSGAADLAIHTHAQPNDTGGDTQSPTGPPV